MEEDGVCYVGNFVMVRLCPVCMDIVIVECDGVHDFQISTEVELVDNGIFIGEVNDVATDAYVACLL